jgi:ADP-ribose pyrophosphatase YjhB (NUDIX family)
MDEALTTFLAGRAPLTFETATWGEIGLEIRYYASDEAPPEHLVTSARAIVLAHDQVLLIRDPSGDEHVIPGGRRKSGESLEETVRREVLEETRWSIADLSILAVGHFHITSSVPADYPYPNPDFLQVVYLARPIQFHEERGVEDDWVASSEMLPIASLSDRSLSDTQRLLLDHALSRGRRRQPKGIVSR